MKKMLAKAVALSLVLGGVGFVSNNAQAADIGNGVKVHSADSYYKGYDVKTSEKINTTFAEQKDLVAVNKEVTAAQKTANDALAADDSIRGEIGQEVANRANADAELDKKIGDEADARIDADNKLSDRIDANKTAIGEETDARVKADKDLSDRIDANKTAIGEETDARVKADKDLSDRINTNVKDIAANKTAIENEVADRKAEVSRLDGRIDKLDARVEKVGAMAAAIANLHTMGYDPEAPTEIAVGVGQYRDKTGMALGAFHYPNRDFMLSFSVSTAGDEYMGGIGATWKFGRKTPEELRQAEAEKAAKAKLAKAEAAKKAAKDARVAAQQKRHAEMLAARTGK
ncbi:YadA-like family protein [Phascolarctobacterium succinatutens]|uniref:YadA-like family protein n=1 Tax=Phascolarctobacterium succinatutens TaxID=626940 RepID=UPI00307DD60F